MSRIDQFRVRRSVVTGMITGIDEALRGANVSPLHRTQATELMFAELFASAAALRPEDQTSANYFRMGVLPQVEALVSGLVEALPMNTERLIKATFSAYNYRCDQAYPKGNDAPRPCIEIYAGQFEKGMQEIILNYPALKTRLWVIEDALTRAGI